MRIIKETISIDELKAMASSKFAELVKAVVDVDRGLLAVDAELHSDLESLLLENGSKQASLWGINLYPQALGESFIEFDSVINIRPSNDNRSRGVDSQEIRKKIVDIVTNRIKR